MILAAARIFLTGATGVIGRRLVPILVGAGHHVTALGRTVEKRRSLEHMGASALQVDLFDGDAVRRAVAGHDVVINLATSIPPTSRMLLPGAWRENDRLRSIASTNLVNAALAAGVDRFLQESFAPIYAGQRDQWIDETSPVKPVRYNRSLVDAENAADRFTQSGRTGVILRFAAFYGPDAEHIAQMLKFVRKGWSPIPASPQSFFSSISHDDAATAVQAALQVSPGIYNVVDDEPLRHREYFDSLAKILGVAPPKIPPAWMAHLFGSLGEMMARSLRISNRKLRDCGWKPKFPSAREGWHEVVEQMHEAA